MSEENSSSTNENLTEKLVRLEELNQEAFRILFPTVVFCVVLMTIGIPGNILVFLVYLTQFRSSTTRVFLLAMSVCDLCTNVISIPYMIHRMRHLYKTNGSSYCVFLGIASHFPIIMSNNLLLCVAFDRWRRVCLPVEWQLNTRQAGQLVVVCFIASSFFLLPVTFTYGERTFNTEYAGLQGKMCHFSNSYSSLLYGIFILLYIVIMLVFVVFAYGSIIVRFYQQDKKFPYSQNLTEVQSSCANSVIINNGSFNISQGKKFSDSDLIKKRSANSETRRKSMVTSKSLTNITPTASPSESMAQTTSTSQSYMQPKQPVVGEVKLTMKHSTAVDTSPSTEPNKKFRNTSGWFTLVDDLTLQNRGATSLKNSPNVLSSQIQVPKTKISQEFSSNDGILASESTAPSSSLPTASMTKNSSRDGRTLWSHVTNKSLHTLIETSSKTSNHSSRDSISLDTMNTRVSSPANTTDKKSSIVLTEAPLLSTRKTVKFHGHALRQEESLVSSSNTQGLSSFEQMGAISSTEISSVRSTDSRQTLRKPVRRNLLPCTTLTMLVMSIISIILYVPYLIVGFRNITFAATHLSDLELNLVYTARVCFAANSVLNILVYSMCNSSFRAACRSCFCKSVD